MEVKSLSVTVIDLVALSGERVVRRFENLANPSAREPSLLRDNEVRDDGEDGDEREDCAGEVEVLGRDGKLEGREEDGEKVRCKAGRRKTVSGVDPGQSIGTRRTYCSKRRR